MPIRKGKMYFGRILLINNTPIICENPRVLIKFNRMAAQVLNQRKSVKN